MKLTCSTTFLALGAIVSLVQADSFPWERLNRNESLLAIVDIQTGLMNLARDFDTAAYSSAIMAHASLAGLFDLPVVMSTSAQTGPNGPISSDILDMYPDAPLIQRQGEINAWDNPDFRAAIEKTGKKQIILAGITTDACVALLALSLRQAGYSVWANGEASGVTTEFVRDISNDRMMRAGVNVVSMVAIMSELLHDLRDPPNPKRFFPWVDKYWPAYKYMAAAHVAAIENGTVLPGEEVTV